MLTDLYDTNIISTCAILHTHVLMNTYTDMCNTDCTWQVVEQHGIIKNMCSSLVTAFQCVVQQYSGLLRVECSRVCLRLSHFTIFFVISSYVSVLTVVCCSSCSIIC